MPFPLFDRKRVSMDFFEMLARAEKYAHAEEAYEAHGLPFTRNRGRVSCMYIFKNFVVKGN